jgi:hypothetical protein
MNQTDNSKEAHAVSGAGEPDAKTRIIVLGGVRRSLHGAPP